MLELLTRNWHLKLLALIIAVALWVGVTTEGTLVREYAVPIEPRLQDGYTLSGPRLTTTTVRLTGPATLLRRVDREGLLVRVDLTNATPGERRTFHLAPENLTGMPRGVNVERIHPDRIGLQIDVLSTRELPVEPSFLGQPPAGYHFYGARITPETLTVEGPKSEVDTLGGLPTDPIRLDNRTEPFVAQVGALPESPDVRILAPRSLEVRVDVDLEPTELVLSSVPVVPNSQMHDSEIDPPSVRVTVSGPPALLEQLRPGQIRAVADVTGLTPRAEPYRVSPRVELVDVPDSVLGRLDVSSVNVGSLSVVVTERRAVGEGQGN
jgi:YbbR domain-containing protein